MNHKLKVESNSVITITVVTTIMNKKFSFFGPKFSRLKQITDVTNEFFLLLPALGTF